MNRIWLILGLMCLVSFAHADDWPQWLGTQRDGIWRETGILQKFPESGPKQVWQASVGTGYSGPSVANGKVYVMDLVKDEGSSQERVLCFDATTGKPIWTHAYDCKYEKVQYGAGPRCTPLVTDQYEYTVGTMGDLRCLKVADGSLVWQKNYLKDFAAKLPIWGFASHPILHDGKLICVTGGTNSNLVIAFDAATGKTLWEAESTEEDCGYAAVVLATFGKQLTAVIWHGGAVLGLDPDTGKRLWRQPFKPNYGLTAPTPIALDHQRLFVTAFYEGPLMMKIADNSVSVQWRGQGKSEKPEGSDKLHSIMPTPYHQDGYLYGVCSYGELRCLKADTGERVWETRQPTVGGPDDEGKPVRWGNAFLTPNADRFFLFNEQGQLVIAKLTPKGYEELDRAQILKPTNKLAGRPVVWVHPAYANKKMFVRNDAELVCVDLAKE